MYDSFPLNHKMEFDHVVRVHPDGTVTDAEGSHYFELRHVSGAKPSHDFSASSDGWSLMNGYSGQYSYSGPIMHDSEFIGGGMERDILSTPGLYVALVCEADPDCGRVDCAHDDDTCTDYEDPEPAGWAVAYLHDEE